MPDQLLLNCVPRTPIQNRLDKKITWAPRKEKYTGGKEEKFCRRCSPKGKDCECGESRDRNAQRCLSFVENDKSIGTEMHVEFTPYSSRTHLQDININKKNSESVENSKKTKECDFRPQLSSKRKLFYANALQN